MKSIVNVQKSHITGEESCTSCSPFRCKFYIAGSEYGITSDGFFELEELPK